MPKDLDRDSTDFPHGSVKGYKRGCRASYPCPATPACATVHATEHAARSARRRRDGLPNGTVPERGTARLGFYVRRRLTSTLRHTTMIELAAHTGMSTTRIRAVRAGDAIWVDEADAAPLDKAWALFVKGLDLDAMPPEAHGRYTTYCYGCRCADCCAARTRSKKMRAIGTPTEATVVPVTEELAAHTRSLLAVAGSRYALERVVGLEPSVLARVAAREGGVQRSTVARLRAHTPASVAAALDDSSLVDAAQVRRQLGMLAALGYPVTWLLRQAGAADEYRLRPEGTKVTVRIARAVQDAFTRLADTGATPEATGLSKQIITTTRNRARAAGFYPAICYDEDGNLDLRALPGHPWSAADRRAAATLDALYLRTRCELSARAISDQVGAEEKNFARICSKVGLKLATASSVLDVFELLPQSRPVAERIEELYWRYDGGQIGPVAALLELGLTATLTLGEPRGSIPTDHPEWVAFHTTTEPAAA